MEEIAATVPGFSGWWLEGDTAVIGLVDPSKAVAARIAVAKWISSSKAIMHQTHNDPTFRFVSMTYDYGELRRFRRIAGRLMEDGLVQSVAISASRNAVRVSPTNDTDLLRLHARLIELGVPAPALLVRPKRQVRQAALLTDSIRPIKGGVVVRAGIAAGCTMTGLVRFPGSSATYYATAGHCTSSWGTISNVQWFQPSYRPGFNGIAAEFAQGDWFYRSFRRCTWADIALAGPATSGDHAFGKITKTTTSATDSAGITIDSTLAGGWSIVGTESWPVEGQYVHKLGIRTGWTTGMIDVACEDENLTHQGIGWTWKCGYAATNGAKEGDSGGPVFLPLNSTEVVFMGISVGMYNNNPALFFQPFGGIELALGTISMY
jgi:hypothetical protein